MTEFETEYFRITDPESSKSGLTSTWTVQSPDMNLGLIYWHAPWRRYVFEPAAETYFDAKCMRELAYFCDKKTREHMKEGEMNDR